MPALSALFRNHDFRFFHFSILRSSGTRFLRRIRTTISNITTPRSYRPASYQKSDHPQNSQINLHQMHEEGAGGRGESMASNGRMYSTDRPTSYNSDLAHTIKTKDNNHAGPFKKIRSMIKGKKSPGLADLTNDTSLGVQIDRSLRRIDSEMRIGLSSSA